MKTDRIPLKEDAGFGVVVLAASAGGQAAILAILRELPLDFDVPVVVVQHLASGSSILDVYAARLPFAFEWVGEDSRLAARKVLVCPPRTCIQLLPDGSFRLDACEGGALDRQIDRMLHSAARSFGHRAIGVVLTGMGDDGASGAQELHAAGGCVLVQTETSADYPDMPRAAVRAGAADLIVPLDDMAQVLIDLVAGAVRPQARSELAAIGQVFGSAGEIALLASGIDWSRTPIGPALGWPLELRLVARTAVDSPHPTAVWWGPELVQIYNEAWRQFLGISKHPQALGGRACETWREIWHDIGPLVERVMKEGVAVGGKDFLIVIERNGFAEEVFADFAYSPIRDAQGAVVGVYNTCSETTEKVVAERRMKALRTLAAQIVGASTPRQVCERAASALVPCARDLPFALLYLFDAGHRQAALAGAAGVDPGSAAAPHSLALVGSRDTWAMERLLEGAEAADSPELLLQDLDRRVPELASLLGAGGGRPVPAGVLVLPLRSAEDRLPIGALVAGLNPQRPLDDDYRSFVRMVAQQVGAGLVEARARELERERLEGLAELDRAKTEFFANVSHEFRTPLTLLLTPLEEMLRQREELPAGLAAQIDVAARNSRRLLRLVNSLLDFSQIEQRRQRAALRPTDLSVLTTDVASAFRSAVERAGLILNLQCPADLPLVPVDREMWEKVVSNLLSNALKFTFEGEIVVRLRELSMHIELVVADTGVGIPKHELPNVFKRFHRVRGARARTMEGSGIGLSLVQDLVSRMGGQLQVQSTEGQGTTFTIWMPLRSFRQTMDAADAGGAQAPAAGFAAELADEAGAWNGERATGASLDEMLDAPKGEHLRRLVPDAHVLVADDNADLRDYLQRLLGAHWKVTAVADGAQALEGARRHRPDLILADVMMPNLDGFALLKNVRGDDALKHTPVIFLTARAGEDTAIEGLLAGVDDYLAKPFSARELIARVSGQIMLARARQRTQELNAFLASFSDAVRGISDPAALARIACRMVVERLGAERAFWADADDVAGDLVIDAAHQPATETPLAGRFPFAAWEPLTSMYSAGTTVVVDDAPNDPRLPDAMKSALVPMGVVAALGLPVLVDGELRGVLGVNQTTPRRWTSEEIALVEGLAGRCWAEVERARGEAAAALAERRAEGILERMGDAHCVLDREFRIVGVNAAAERVLKQPRAMLLGRSHWEAFPASVDAPVGAAFRRVVEAGIEQHLAHHYTGEGYDMHVELDAYPTDEGGVAMFWRDVTERRRAEMALRESEARYRTLFDSIDEGFCVIEVLYDDAGHPNDLRYLETNPAFVRQSGLHDAVGRTIREFVPAHEPHWFEIYGRIVQTGEPIRFEAPAAAMGRWFDVYAFRVGDPLQRRVASLFSDVTSRKEAERSLLASEERLRTFVSATSDTVYEMSADWRVMHSLTGRSFIAATDSPREDWLEQYIPDEEKARVRSAIQLAISTRSNFELEHRIVAPDGLTGWTFSRAVPLFDERGEIVKWFGAASDISDRKHAEAALRISEERMRRLNQALQAAMHGAPLAESLNVLSHLVTAETASEARTAFYMADADGLQLHPVRGVGDMPDAYLDVVDGFLIGEDSLACGLAVPTGRPVLTRDVFEDPRWVPWTHIARDHDYRGCWSFPIKTRERRAVGTFAMYFRAPRDAAPHDLALAEVVTQTAAVILANHRDAQERDRATEALRESEARYRALHDGPAGTRRAQGRPPPRG